MSDEEYIYDVLDDLKSVRLFKIEYDTRQKNFSETLFAKNIEWTIEVAPRFFRVKCNSGSNNALWHVDVDFEFRVLSQMPATEDYVESASNHFDYLRNETKIAYQQDDIWNVECGYLVNNIATIEIEISVMTMQRMSYFNYDFTSAMPSGPDANAILIVEDKKVRVNKKYISMYSEFFNSLFNGEVKKEVDTDYNESSENEVELKNVHLYQFLDLLRVIYPQHNKVKRSTYKHLLELADRFEMQFVINQCEEFLRNEPNDTLYGWMNSLAIADKFNMHVLQDYAIMGLRNAGVSLHELNKTDGFQKMSKETRLTVFEKYSNLGRTYTNPNE